MQVVLESLLSSKNWLHHDWKYQRTDIPTDSSVFQFLPRSSEDAQATRSAPYSQVERTRPNFAFLSGEIWMKHKQQRNPIIKLLKATQDVLLER